MPRNASSSIGPVFTLACLALTGVLLASALEAGVKVLNAAVSYENYDKSIQDLNKMNPLYTNRLDKGMHLRRSVVNGVVEGVVHGAAASLLYIIAVAVFTQGECSYWFAARYLVSLLALAYLLGVVTGFALEALQPDAYWQQVEDSMFAHGIERELYIAFVRNSAALNSGAVWGLRIGGAFSLVLGIVAMRHDWLVAENENAPADMGDA